ncbi:hypothetical protein C1H46_039360 [Malus baccata]|uniref:NOL1/NOP2/NSUN 5/7 ferredoxin-like domain-containing protein n=1 Tax=Malus baccata TaxID=106549 RepID=A0A540KLH9_MALBA|nr:hypothetical protein C1H46_039360 [Malus baccata]
MPCFLAALSALTVSDGVPKAQSGPAACSRRQVSSSAAGDAEKYLMRRQEALQSALAGLLFNTSLCSSKYSALLELEKQMKVQKDDLVPDLLVLPPGSDLRDHPLIMDGSIVMQASSVVAAALAPKPGWEVLDASLAPGNKTVHPAALMRGKREMSWHHSCSGSGTASARLDHLLPSSAPGAPLLPVPEVESFVHSTCSVNQVENEDVIKSVLPLAASHGFQLETAFPKWHRHGLPSVEGAECLVRTDPKEDKEGFFIAPVTNQRYLTEPMEPAF